MSTVVLGLDGADPELVEKWLEELPNFRKLKQHGFIGSLDSIIPPITVPAWMCMFSSQPPEFFDSYDFRYLDTEHYENKVVNSGFFRGKTLIDDVDRETISFRVPGTTPSYDVNGVMVSGFLMKESMDFRPEEVGEELKKETGISGDLKELHEGDKQDIADENFEKNAEAFKWLIENKEFDRAFSVFRLIDTYMHNVDSEEEMKHAYTKADRYLGEIMDLCKKNQWDLLVVSDHGSVETEKKFYINSWLREKGYLSYKDSEETGQRRLLEKIASLGLKLGIKPVLKKANSVFKDFTGKDLQPRSGNTLENIEMSETEAFSYLSGVSNFGAVWINDEDRFPKGIVEDRDSKIQEIKSMLEEEQFIEEIYMNEELYENEKMPDIIFKAFDNIVVGPELYHNNFHHASAVVHGFEGLIGGIGPYIKNKDSEISANLVDVGSTIEALEGKVKMREGKPIKEILDREFEQEEKFEGLDI